MEVTDLDLESSCAWLCCNIIHFYNVNIWKSLWEGGLASITTGFSPERLFLPKFNEIDL